MAMVQPGEREALATPASSDVAEYDFLRYVTKKRMISFWYHLTEILQRDVQSVLEIGIGPRVVSSVLRGLGKEVETADLHPGLKPDYLVSVQQLSTVIPPESFDLVLCARVLHWVPLEELDNALAELHAVTRRYVIVTLPVDELRLNFGFSVTSRTWHWTSVRLPRRLKHALLRLIEKAPASGRPWRLNGRAGLTRAKFEARLSKLFIIEKSYAMPEVATHHVFVLRKRGAAPAG